MGVVHYEETWRAMQVFTRNRSESTPDEFWALQHPPVYTLGLAGKREHLLAPGDIPIVPIDRGGQVTYHGPGQLVIYTLVDIGRLRIGVREFVRRIESSIIATLASLNLNPERRAGMPGVYLADAKIAALGLKVSRGCTYHGLALNVDVELEPFSRINPCGYADLSTTSIAKAGVNATIESVSPLLLRHLQHEIFCDVAA
jgi:lipoyl(octanoyl) transferase